MALPNQSQVFNIGSVLVEIIIAIALLAVLAPTIVDGIITTRQGEPQNNQRLQALAFLKQTQEELRVVRERGWDLFSQNGTFHLSPFENTFSLVGGTQTIGDFSQSIIIENTYRDINGDIGSSGSLDPSVKSVTATISWQNPSPSNISSFFYLTRYLDNLSFTETTVADFNLGEHHDTTVTNDYGGEVILGSGGNADWCQPQDALVADLSLPKRGNSIVAKEGSAYIASGDGTNGVTFLNISIDNPPHPEEPTPSIIGTYESDYKTNAIYNDGNYVYLATDGSSSQINILDISSSPPYSRIGWIDIPSGLPANGVYVTNNTAYITSGNRLYSFDVTNKNGSHTTVRGSVAMWVGWGNEPMAKQVVVVGNYAFVGTGDTLFGLQKFRINNNGASFRLVGVSNLTWNQTAQGLYVSSNGNRAYVAFNQGSGIFPKGFFIVNTSLSDPPLWWPLPNFYNITGSYSTGDTDPRGMTVVPGNRAIVVGIGGTHQYQVVNIVNENNPIYCGGLSIDSGVFGIASVLEADGDAYSYSISGEDHDQFKIIKGGPGGRYALEGYFTSAIFETSHDTAFNRFFENSNKPDGTEVRYQFASAKSVNSDCSLVNYVYLGPDGTTNTYYQADYPIYLSTVDPDYKNPGQCFRYRVYLTSTNNTSTPVFNEITINYSP